MTNSIPESKSLIWVIDIKSIDCIIVYIFEPVFKGTTPCFLTGMISIRYLFSIKKWHPKIQGK